MDNKIIDLPDVRLLEEEETRQLIKAAQNGEQSALDKLVKHNLRLVLKITYRYKNSEYNLQDLFQIGVIGLIKAIKAFDLNKGVKLSTYAVSRIIGQIRLHLRDDGMIKVSRKLKKISKVVKQKEEELKKEWNREPTINELVQETGYSREEIVRALEANKGPRSIFQKVYEDNGSELLLLDSLKDRSEELDIDNINKFDLVDVLKELDERSRKIIYLRYFEDKTQQEIGEEIGVSQVQISRLEKKILHKLKNSL